MLKAVIFDFDGVITDSEALHLSAFNEVLSPFNIRIKIKEYYQDYLGLTDVDCFRAVARDRRVPLNKAQIAKLFEQKKQVFKKLAKTQGKIIEGVREFLEMLKQNRIPMAICSGAVLSEIELILQEANLRELFSVIVSAEMVEKGKPAPDGFILALEKLNRINDESIKAQECIVVEDSHWGLTAAEKAGMHTIAVTNSYDADELAAAEKIVDRLDELTIEQLKSLCG